VRSAIWFSLARVVGPIPPRTAEARSLLVRHRYRSQLAIMRAGSRLGVFLWDFSMPLDPATDKSFTYFALLEALDKQGCPVCRFMAEYSLTYLEALFYEQVNDVGLRQKLRASRGFCNWHAWQARQIASSALGVAIMANDLITEEMSRLDKLLRGPTIARLHHGSVDKIALKSVLAFVRGWRQKGVCPACQVVLGHERHALETILDFLGDEDFARRFEHSAPMCILHTTRVVETQNRHPQLRRLIGLQHRKYAQLVGELDELCRKHDYRFTHESWGAESDAWLRAIELLVGKPEGFGNDIHRMKPGGSRSGAWSTLRDWLLG
jgi:Family of unknown function (DUF6062)